MIRWSDWEVQLCGSVFLEMTTIRSATEKLLYLFQQTIKSD